MLLLLLREAALASAYIYFIFFYSILYLVQVLIFDQGESVRIVHNLKIRPGLATWGDAPAVNFLLDVCFDCLNLVHVFFARVVT
jgi:hypothetical protein